MEPSTANQQLAAYRELASLTNSADKITDDAGNILGVGFSNHPSLAPERQSAPGLNEQAMRKLLDLPYLETVALQSQPLPDTAYDYLAGIPNLRAVAISDPVFVPGLTHACVQSLQGKANQLEILDLEGTEAIENDILPLLYGFPELRFLRIDGKQADDSVVEFTAGSPALQAIDLLRTQLTDSGFARLVGNVGGLRVLRLSADEAAPLDYRCLRHLPGLQSLESLTLTGEAFTDIPWEGGLENLAEMERLRTVRLAEVPPSQESAIASLDKLKTARPDLDIEAAGREFDEAFEFNLDWRVGIL